jgi:hypothetical protein
MLGRDIILGEYWCEMGEVWAPPPRYAKTATLPPVSITNRGRIGSDYLGLTDSSILL